MTEKKKKQGDIFLAGIDGTAKGWVVARGIWRGGRFYSLYAHLVKTLAQAIDTEIDCYS